MFKIAGHIVLSALLLFSATGLTINMHFCGGHLYDLALNAPAHDCCDSDMDDNACHHGHNQAMPHQCDDETIQLEAINDLFVSSYTYEFHNEYSSELLFLTQLLIKESVTTELPVYGILHFKKPPPTQEVVLSQIQSYLI
jgi:hypothetical protein